MMYRLITIIFIIFCNCLSLTAKREFAPRKIEIMKTHSKFEGIQASASHLKLSWNEIQTTKINTKFNPITDISEKSYAREACIPNSEILNKYITVVTIDSKTIVPCPKKEIYKATYYETLTNLENTIFFPQFKIFVDKPKEKYDKRYTPGIALESENIVDYPQKDISIFGDNEAGRIYIKLDNGKILAYHFMNETEDRVFFSRYLQKEWEESDQYWFKKSRKLKHHPISLGNSISIISYPYEITTSNPRRRKAGHQFLSFEETYSKNYKVFLFENYEKEMIEKSGYSFLFYPITIPIDIITSPLQLIYLGPFEYFFSVYCFFGYCKTPLG